MLSQIGYFYSAPGEFSRGNYYGEALAKLRNFRIMNFEWDLAKAQENLEKHGISFDLAARALGDPLAIEDVDDREDYGEERIRSTAMADGIILRVVYTVRDDYIRIISARKATRHEEDDYYLENGA